MPNWIYIPTAGGSWVPSDLASLVAWYDADDASTLYDATSGGNLVTSHNAQVKRWEDKSGNGRHATQNDANGPKIQTTSGTLDSKPVMKFVEASSSFLTVADAAALRTYPIGVLVVVRTSQTEANNGVVGKWGASGHRDWNLLHSGVSPNGGKCTAALRNSADSANITAVSTGGVGNGAARLLGAVFDPPGGDIDLFIDGTLDGTTSATSSNGASTVSLAIGSYSPNANDVGLTGDLAEIVIWNSASDSDRQHVEGYLAWKWGLEGNLPQDHPYKAAAP